ncbi:thiamine pyrophosphate-dependent enzyme [Streptomyces sp. NPDC002076]
MHSGRGLESLGGAEALRHATLWPAIQSFPRPGETAVVELGTSLFGAQVMRLAAGATFIGRPLWASVGYALPAALGAQLAAPGRRTIRLQIDNGRYAVERRLHGGERRYSRHFPVELGLRPAAPVGRPGRARASHGAVARRRRSRPGTLNADDTRAVGAVRAQG